MKLNTVAEVELIDGTKVECTLTYRALLQLSTKAKDAYDEYNRIFTKGAKTEIDNLRIVYTAYLCAWVLAEKPVSHALTFDDFIDNLIPDRVMVQGALATLLNPKKATASAALSSAAV